MPLTEKGQEIMQSMKEEYGPEKGESVFYASKNAGTISGVDVGDAITSQGLEHLTEMAFPLTQQYALSQSGTTIDSGMCGMDAIDAGIHIADAEPYRGEE